MSKLLSCFACTEKQKRRKYGNDLDDGKIPKDKRQKKLNGKKQKRKEHLLNNQLVTSSNDCKPDNTKDKRFEFQSKGDHFLQKRVTGNEIGDHSKEEPRSNNEILEPQDRGSRHLIPQIQVNSGLNAGARRNTNSSDRDSSDAGSCLTDSDLNISEAVFITEEGPRVGSLGASLSRMGLQTMRATMENERRLEKELLDRVSTGSWNRKIAPNLRLSVENVKVLRDERNF